MATLVPERQLNELRKKNHIGQILANVQFKYTPFPGVGGHFVPYVPRAANRGPEVPGIAWVTRKEEDHAGRAQGLRVPFQV